MEEGRNLLASIRIFLSYNSKDKKIAGTIKKYLEDIGFEVFVAHDDIPPSENFNDIILKDIKRSDIFMPLLTKTYPESKYADQETGFALCLQKKIMPLKLEIDPYGFISHIQAMPFNPLVLGDSCYDIARAIINDKEFHEIAINCLIRALYTSPTFNDTKFIVKILWEVKKFSKEQVEKIAKVGAKNHNVYRAYPAKPFLQHILEHYSAYVDPDLRSEIEMYV